MAKIYIGTASFTEKGLEGTFYPKGIKPAERISYYAQFFNAVEIDSSYYALPSTRNSVLFNQRTPDNFVFHFKAFGLMTKHRVQTKQLGKALYSYLPEDYHNPYVVQPPQDLLRAAFNMFYEALIPLKINNKLGMILFQYPPYFINNDENKNYILQCKEWMRDYKLAIEFRHNSWTNANSLKSTLDFLKENDLSYVSVDEPQFDSGLTIPPIAEATSSIAYIRFHGRNTRNWFRKNATVEQRFDYFYTKEELSEWIPKIKKLSEKTEQIHIMFNNCVSVYPVVNANDMAILLGVKPGKKQVEIIDQTTLI